MAKKTFCDIIIGDKEKAYNCSKYTKKQALEDYEREYGFIPVEDYIYYTYFRYKTKEEVIADGDWEEIAGYEDGSMQLYEECFKDDKGAFKCMVVTSY